MFLLSVLSIDRFINIKYSYNTNMTKKGVLTKEEREILEMEFSKGEKIKTSSSISYDGKNFLIRIPKDIIDYFGVTKLNRKNKKINFIVIEEENNLIKQFDISDEKNKTNK